MNIKITEDDAFLVSTFRRKFRRQNMEAIDMSLPDVRDTNSYHDKVNNSLKGKFQTVDCRFKIH